MAEDDLVVNDRLTLPAGELEWSYARSGGPGGQHVNKTETKAVLRFHVAGSHTLRQEQRARLLERLASRLTKEGWLVVHAEGRRSRLRNQEDARERLAELLREGLRRPRTRRRTRPTRASKERRLAEKKRRGETKRRRRGDLD